MERTIISGANVLTREGAWEQAQVVIENGMISSTGAAGAPETTTIDASGKWIIPGLIDAHVHLLLSTDSPRDDSDQQRLLKATRNARKHLLAGVTRSAIAAQ